MYMNVRANPRDSDYRKCWHKLAQIVKPGPAKALVFIDENEKSIQQSAFGINAPDRWWLFGTSQWTWISFPATRHNNGCTFTFADGHAETWRWLEPNTARISGLNTWTVLQPGVVAVAAPLVLSRGRTYALNISVTSDSPAAEVARDLKVPLLALKSELFDALGPVD